MKNEAPKKALSSYQNMKQKYEASIRQLTDDIITLVEEKVEGCIKLKKRKSE